VGRFVIGEGVLTWHPRERISDRYGTVFLMTGGDSQHEPGGYVPVPDDAPVGLPGRLVAEVQATRQSTHVGDLFRGLRPETPEVGERIVLGEGRLFCQTVDREEGIEAVGCTPEPEDPRDSDWLDPRALYRAHEQTVRLVFEDDPVI
jgi:hypothetical protein